MVVVETHKHVRIRVIQSLDEGITTTWVETIVAPSIDVIKRGVLIGFIIKLGSGSSGVSVVRNLSRSSALPTFTTGVVHTPRMVFTNLIMTTHVNRTVDGPLMSLMATRGYRSVNVTNLKGGYSEPFIVTTPILDHIDGHYVRPNKVALKYLDF